MCDSLQVIIINKFFLKFFFNLNFYLKGMWQSQTNLQKWLLQTFVEIERNIILTFCPYERLFSKNITTCHMKDSSVQGFAASQIFNFLSALVSKEVELLRELQDLKKTIDAMYINTRAARCLQAHNFWEWDKIRS